MRKKNMMKRILSMVCVVAMLATTFFTSIPSGSKVEAAENVGTQNAESELTYLTLKDFSIASGKISSSTGYGDEQTYAPGFDNTVVSFYGNFTSGGPRIHLGGRSDYSREGIIVYIKGSELLVTPNSGCFSGDASRRFDFDVVTVKASDWGFGETFFNQKLLYEMKTEFIDAGSDGNKNDIRFTLIISKKTVASVVIENQLDKLGNMFRICDPGANTLIAGYKELAYTEVENYDFWTYTDVDGIDGEKINATTNKTLTGTLNESYFAAKLNFPTTDFGNLYIGAGDWYGIAFTANGESNLKVQFISTNAGTINLGVLTPEIAGVALRGNAELEMGVSVKFVDVNVSAQTTKLEVGIWVNGELYDGAYFETSKAVAINDCVKRIHSYALKSVEIYSVTDRFEKTISSDFTKYTLADINPVYTNGNMSGYIPKESLDNVLYSANIKYTADSQQFHYGADDNSYGGVTLYSANSRANLIYARVAGSLPSIGTTTISAQDALGKDAFTDEFLLQITTEYVDSDFDGEKDDVKLGLWFEGKLYKSQYFYHADVVSKLGVRVTANEAGTPKLASYYDELPSYVEDYVDWTFEHACMSTGSKSGNWFASSKVIGEVLDKSMFHGYVTFDGSHQRVFIGHTSTYQGIGFVCKNDQLQFGSTTGTDALAVSDTFSPADCGLETFAGARVKLSVATRFVEIASRTTNEDGTTTTKIVVEAIPLVNGKMPNGKIHQFTIDGKNFLRKVSVGTNGTLKLENVDCAMKLDDLPEGLTTVHMNDLGLADEVTNWANGSVVYYDKGSFDDTIIPFTINYGDTKPIIRWAQATSIYSGIGLNRAGDNMQVGGNSGTSAFNAIVPAVTVAPEEGKSFANRDVKFDIVTQYIDMDYDGQEDDLKYGVYIDGKLVNGSYHYAYDAVQYLGSAIGLQNASIPYITTGGTTVKTLDESKYDNYTLIDAGIKDGKHASFGKLFDEEGLEITGSAYDGVLFGAKVKFQDESARINYASVSDVESMFDGITIRLKGNDLYLQKLAGNLSYTATTIAASQFGYDTFIGRAFKLQLTTDVVNLDSEEEANDVLLGIWIDGQLANNTYVRLMDQAELLDCYINFNEGANTEFYSLWDIEAPADRDTEYYTISKENPYLVIADYLTDAKGAQIANGTEVSVSGDYTAHYLATEELEGTSYSVVLWRPYDFSADGAYTVADLVALKKVANGATLGSNAAQMAASQVDSAYAFTELREYLTGQTAALSADVAVAEAELVMPIGSWIGPSAWNGFYTANGLEYFTDYGLETNFLQDKYYAMIQDLGINEITYTQEDYNTTGKYSILKGLAMADKYNLKSYVDDSYIADDITSVSTLASRLKVYSRYASFAGLHVYDEPCSDDFFYRGANRKNIKEIANKTALLNKYQNTSGLVNLYPAYNLLGEGDINSYKQYLEDYIAMCNPKMLSYDDYPFSTEETVEDSKYYFNNLSLVREAANKAGIPFRGCIGTGEDYTQSAIYTDDMLPTAEQLKWNVNTLLAYGAKGYNWFTLIQPWYFALEGDGSVDGMDFNRLGLIGADGSETRNYETAKEINAWVSVIDSILMESKSVDILATGTYAQENTGVKKATYADMTVSASNTTYGAIVGVFDYNGKTVYYVVNNDVEIDDGELVGNESQEITLTFTADRTMTVYNGTTTETLNATTCTVDIEAGGAALVVVE